jgi:lipid A 3-O-deacylase
MIGSECPVRKEKGPCTAERTAMDVIAAKVSFPAPRVVMPGKEEFCFFVCPLPLPAQRGLRVALPVMTDAFKRLALLIGAVLLLATVPGAVKAGEILEPAQQAEHRWITEAGFITGYGNGSIDEGSYKTLMLMAHFGADINRFIPALRHHRGVLSFFLEPQFNPVLTPSESEFGLGIGLQYTYPLMEWISPYFLVVTGPHYISVDTTTQSEGFNFASAVGFGFYLALTKNIALNCGYRYRHVSNADLRQPNGAINSHIGLLGVSFFF